MRVDSFVPATGTMSNNGADVLSKLKPGDTIRAQVLENSGKELTLKLADGSKVSASATSPVDAGEGEFVNFVYKGTVDGKPALEVASRTVQPQVDEAMESIKTALTELELPATNRNIELAQALKTQNIPITADSMSKIMDLVSKNTELKLDSAAFLTAANMSNDMNNIEKLQSLLAGRLKISNDIGDLMKLISSEGNNSAIAVKSTTVNNILEKLAAEMVSKGILQEGAVPNSKVNNAASPNTATTANTNTATTANVSNSANSTANTNANNTTNSSSNNVAGTNSNINTNSANVGTANINANSVATDVANNSSVNNNTNNATTVATSTNVNNVASSNIESLSNNEATKLNDSTSSVEQQISKLLKGGEPLGKADLPLLTSLSSQLESMVSKGTISTQEKSAVEIIAKEINVAIFKIQGKEVAIDQVSSKNIKSFETAVNNLNNLFVKIDQSSDEINPVKLYRDMNNELLALKNSIQQLPMTMREVAMNITNNLESNVNFINQLNNYSSYVQIPLSIFNQNTTGELYMLKKGSKSRKLDPSNMTILISLDSNNIGRIDTLLSIDKKNISTNFRLENSDVFKVLKENHRSLYLSMLEKGYRLVDFTYKLMDEPINIVNFEAEAKKEFIKSPNNIDIVI